MFYESASRTLLPLLLIIFLCNGSANTSNSNQLATSEECKKDVELYCHSKTPTDFDVIECLQSSLEITSAITPECHHKVWTRKHELTLASNFKDISEGVCNKDFLHMVECSELDQNSKELIPCMVNYIHKVKHKPCKNILKKIASTIFADHRLIYKFLDSCQSEVDKYRCGRIPVEFENTSQESTISCLELRIEKLNNRCQHEIFRIREIQGEDYHLDSELFFACREDRENLCGDVNSGDGRVYACLFENKFNEKMSSKCRKVLTLRQRLRSLDAKIDSKFIQKCEADILKHECSQLPDPEKHFSNELSTIMVCLESVNNDFMNGYLDEDLEPQCIVELERLQKELISDYKINPNVVFKCESVISQHCSKVEELRDGSVLHCIMGVIKDPKYTKSVPADCTKAIHDLLKVSEVVDDARLDPVLSKACSALLSSDCSKSNIGEDGSEHRSMKTLQCLMQNRDNSKMTEECARSISELEYFFIRDLSMDNEFKRSCKADAEKFCHVSKGDWKSSHGVDQLLINCLWKVGPAMAEDSLEDHLSPPCFNYIFGLMELDAQYFDMHPYVFKECLADALEHCHEAISSVYSPANATETIDEKTNVLYCLQSKIKIIRPNCMTALEEMMKNIEHYPTIDSQIRKSCSNLFARFCSKNDHKDSLRCLIKHKNTDENNPVCKAAIDHVQIMQMQDLELSTEFKQACNNDRTKLCKNLPKPISTHSIIKCLMAYKISELAELEGEPRIMTKTLEPKCAKMLSFEVFQQHEMVALDKDVTEKCAREIKMFCAKYSDSEGQILGCLRRNSNNLGVLCHRVVFIRELEEAKDSSVDAELMSRCRVPIQIYCPAHGYYAESEVGIKNDMFFCLLQAFKVDGEREHFSKDCRFVLTERMEEFQNDYRLDTNFVDNCMPDVEKFCSKELTKKEGDLVTYRGKILQCMKKAYMNYSHDMANGVQVSKYEFSSKICVNDIENHIGLSNLNYHFDPYLRDACQNEIGTLCANEIVKENDNKDELWIELEGSVTECLKNALMEKKISNKNCKMEISRKIDESRDDVSSDLLMSEACSVVLATKCSKVKPGQFRQMNCLLYLNEQNELPIRCKRVVEKRQQMWEGATKPLAPESLSDLYQLVSGSAIRHFFIGFFAALVAIIFIIGICAGRITKRVPVDMKRR